MDAGRRRLDPTDVDLDLDLDLDLPPLVASSDRPRSASGVAATTSSLSASTAWIAAGGGCVHIGVGCGLSRAFADAGAPGGERVSRERAGEASGATGSSGGGAAPDASPRAVDVGGAGAGAFAARSVVHDARSLARGRRLGASNARASVDAHVSRARDSSARASRSAAASPSRPNSAPLAKPAGNTAHSGHAGTLDDGIPAPRRPGATRRALCAGDAFKRMTTTNRGVAVCQAVFS